MESQLAHVSVETVSEKNNLPKENQKMNHGEEANEPIKFSSHGTKESIKEEGKKVPLIGLRKDAVEDWPEPKQIHSFYIVRYRRAEDQTLKPKYDQAEKELQKMNQARFQIIEKLRAKREERSQLIGQRKSVSAENQEFWTVIEGKRKEIKPLQDALGKLRGPRKAGREGGSSLCSSEEELDNLIKNLQYRIQHESIPLTEEKQILREIKRLEGTRGEVKEHAALRAQIQDSMGEKETIQKQVMLISGNLDGVLKEQQAVKAKRKQLDDQLDANTSQINSFNEELKEVTMKRDKAFAHVQELRNQREEGNAPFYQNFALLQKAKLLADKKDVEALKELSLTEVDKFISLWSGSKPFRDDYERRILTSLDIRQLSRDGRMRNPDEKPLVLPQAQTVSQTDIVEKTTAGPSKEESVPAQKVNKEKNTKKPKDASSKVTESTTKKNILDVEEEIYDLEKQPKDVKPKSKESDEAKLREMKREEEIAKNRQAMERKKKLAEKAAAKAAIKAQKEAEKRKLKEIILIILPFGFGFGFGFTS
ncbi:cyclophilin peptidyl-prolyl cis-trans isomerase Cyp2 [Datura stramonium]|uniref:Cyclophilin peptidyl-prolyl cis-trans isomerase Cyp2 n=1 Tax=Datura stramonium TaxID=4076 RepID=A0ABS8T6X4_DATST|nr:cyclophilin peptidyl-prolyl cis-trans isomerase Cyp2 [Datura stramonium]